MKLTKLPNTQQDIWKPKITVLYFYALKTSGTWVFWALNTKGNMKSE